MKIKYVLETPEGNDEYSEEHVAQELADRFEQFLTSRGDRVFVLPPGVLLREVEVPCCEDSHG